MENVYSVIDSQYYTNDRAEDTTYNTLHHLNSELNEVTSTGPNVQDCTTGSIYSAVVRKDGGEKVTVHIQPLPKESNETIPDI